MGKETEPSLEKPESTWKAETIAKRLKTKAEAVRHPAHGEGAVFPLGPEGKLRLETYPETRSVRLVGTNAELNLYRKA
jgi:hypothetical protein